MSSSNLSVSVITPAYNEERHIEETLLSVKEQKFENLEHIVINDGSTDRTGEILQQYTDEYDLTIVHQENNGQAAAVNRGFELVNGDIIVWLNADDVLLTNDAIRTVAKTFSQNPEVDFVYGNHAIIDDQTNIRGVHVPVPWFDSGRLLRWCFAAFIFMRHDVVKKQKLDSNYDYALDYEFYLRAAAGGSTFKYVDDVLLGYRSHAHTKSQQGATEMHAEGNACRRKYGLTFDTEYRIHRVLDRVLNNILRLYAIVVVFSLSRDSNRLVFPESVEGGLRTVYRQLKTIHPRSEY